MHKTGIQTSWLLLVFTVLASSLSIKEWVHLRNPMPPLAGPESSLQAVTGQGTSLWLSLLSDAEYTNKLSFKGCLLSQGYFSWNKYLPTLYTSTAPTELLSTLCLWSFLFWIYHAHSLRPHPVPPCPMSFVSQVHGVEEWILTFISLQRSQPRWAPSHAFCLWKQHHSGRTVWSSPYDIIS